ncbi:hypothetical protein D9M72_361640 [compost metagenome]
MAAGRARSTAVALERGHALVIAARCIVARGAREVAEPVLLAGEEGAPRRLAGAAVVERAARLHAGGRVLGLHQRVAHCRTGDVDLRQGRDAAVEGRVLDVAPLTAAVLTHFEDRNAVNGSFLVHFRRRAGQRGGAAIGVQEE